MDDACSAEHLSPAVRENTRGVLSDSPFQICGFERGTGDAMGERVGGVDGDGVSDTATAAQIIVTTVTHRHAASESASGGFFCLRECGCFRTGSDAR